MTINLNNDLIIESDGTRMGTVIKTKTGVELLGVKRLEYILDAEEDFARVTLHVDMTAANLKVMGDGPVQQATVVEKHYCPGCRCEVPKPGECHDCYINRVAP